MKAFIKVVGLILVILVSVAFGFGLGFDRGASTQLQSDKKLIEASIKIKKNHSEYHVEYPVQDYKPPKIRTNSI